MKIDKNESLKSTSTDPKGKEEEEEKIKRSAND
jgi:hypothetical protein